MSDLKTQPTKVKASEFLSTITDPKRREDAVCLVELMNATTGKKPVMWGSSIVGFGEYHYRYESGREGDCFLAGFSPRKNDLTIYISGGLDRHQALLAKLGKHKRILFVCQEAHRH